MTSTRRDILKFIVTGSIAAGCPIDLSLLAAPDAPNPDVDGEHFEICHKIRDGEAFSKTAVSKNYDVVIVGGGISGLSAAYFLRSKNFLLVEKEDHWGGNAYREDYEGEGFATGSAYDFVGSQSAALAKEIGLEQLPVNCPDPTIVNGKWIADTWRAGLDELPYPHSVRDAFKKFRSEMLKINVDSNPAQYDNEPLTKYLQGYPAELKQWWDGYGLSNWGAKSEDTSFYVAMEDFADFAADKFEDSRITLPGGNGAITQKLSQTLLAKFADRMLAGATTVSVEPQQNSVDVTYLHQGKLETAAAKAVIMATPKLISSRLVAGIPSAQVKAMQSIRYAPYPVINMIFDKPVYNRGYDTWCPGNTFTDFIVADWTVRNQLGYKQKNNILSFYTPLDEDDRHKLLSIEGCQRIAMNALRDFNRLLPEFNVDPIEIHMYRRGHPMFMATPGNYTRTIPAARTPLDRVFFANADSEGPESLATGGVSAAQKGAEWVEKRLSGASAQQAKLAVGLAG
ncbi:MAG: FAD-dependent oxidoreductase [Candidatus Acidiferrales bacterium]